MFALFLFLYIAVSVFTSSLKDTNNKVAAFVKKSNQFQVQTNTMKLPFSQPKRNETEKKGLICIIYFK